MPDDDDFRATRCPPDDLFGVTHATFADGVVQASMSLEDWCFEVNGVLAAGALGVLVDNVLGYANITRAPGRWGITTAMTLDLFPAACAPGDRLHADARVVRADSFSALAEGRVLSPTGGLVATCAQRTRFVDVLPEPHLEFGGTPAPLLQDVMAAAVRPDGADIGVEVRRELRNPLGALHGGVSMYVCDRAVAQALQTAGSPLAVVTLQLSYLRLIRAAEHVVFRPAVIHRGRTLAVVDVAGSLSDGRPAVVARATAESVS